MSGWGGKHSRLPVGAAQGTARRDETLTELTCQTVEFEERILADTKNCTLWTICRGRKHVHTSLVTYTQKVYMATGEEAEERLPRTKTAAVSRMTGIISRRLGLSVPTPPLPGGRGSFQKATPTLSSNSTDSLSPGQRPEASMAEQHLQLELFSQ